MAQAIVSCAHAPMRSLRSYVGHGNQQCKAPSATIVTPVVLPRKLTTMLACHAPTPTPDKKGVGNFHAFIHSNRLYGNKYTYMFGNG